MQIRPVNYSDYRINKTTQKSSPVASSVSFSGIRRALTTVAPENFKSDTAKKLFSQIHKYCQILKTGGSLNEVKILSEDLDFLNYKTMQDFTTKVDTLLSIKSDSEKALIKLYRRYQDKTKHCLMEAQLDKKGQMVKGMHHYGRLRFERNKNNIRRLYSYDAKLLPYGDNDKEWGLSKDILPIRHQRGDNSSTGVFEIFIELARLYTTMYNQ